MADSNLPVSSGSFESIKQNLTEFMEGQEEFKDYDFSGSRLNVLMGLLAYNTMYMQHYSNAALYEGFQRTANNRSSVIQHAQDDGYNPAAMSAATHTVRIKGSHLNNPVQVSLPVGTRFSADVNGVNYYDFVTWEEHILIGVKEDPLNPSPELIYEGNIELIQGVIGRQEYIYTDGMTLTLRDPDLDRNYVRVLVDGAEWTNWTDKSIVNTTGGSSVYYVRETVDGYTEIYFGEGEETDYVESAGAYNPKYIGGLKPVGGQKITVTYIKTTGPNANGSQRFTFADDINNFLVRDEDINDNPYDDDNFVGAIGGGYPEGTERIRGLAPLLRESQRRCVTKHDYETFISQKYGNIVQAIQAFGSSNKPGYVFIAIKPIDGLTVPQVIKEDMQNYLDEFNIITITPQIVDPQYLYVRHDLKVNYRTGSIPEGADYLKAQIIDSISNYYDEEVEIFEASFHVSRMLAKVDVSHPSILGSRCDINLVREVYAFTQTPMAGISFINPITHRSVSSAEVTYVPEEYSVYIKSTDGTTVGAAVNTGKLLLGPFADGDITNKPEYTGTDFDRVDIDGRTKYYEIGTVAYDTGLMDYDFGELGKNTSDWDVTGNLVIDATPTRTNLYTDDGTLIVFENKLRPEYTTITLEGIA